MTKSVSFNWKGKLLATGSNAKTVKGDGSEYVTAIMYLAPARNVDGINLCPMAILAGCETACLFTAGRGIMSNVKAGRIRKTVLFRDNRAAFMADLVSDLEKFSAWAQKRNVTPVCRPNGTSDIRWETINVERWDGNAWIVYDNIMAAFPEIQFYDYTKILNRRVTVPNYHLTISYSNASQDYARNALASAKRDRRNLAVVFRDAANIPATYADMAVVDGDKDDLRFLDPRGVVVALYAKGAAKKDHTGFVVDVE